MRDGRGAPRPPRWSRALLRRLAPPAEADEVLGDLEETHRIRVRRRGRLLAGLLTAAETLDMAAALLRERRRERRGGGRPTREAAGAGIAQARRASRLPTVSWLDFKLGLRMLVRYPGLTVVGGLAMAFGIALGSGAFQFLTDAAFPTLPGDGGAQVVQIENVSTRTGRPDTRVLHDFALWRDELGTVEGVGAWRLVQHNLSVGGEASVPVRGAAITASALALAPVPPLLGRTLAEADEASTAPAVAVLAHDFWRARFGADPGVLGRVIRLAGEPTTVVGVMPEGFEFPFAQDFWLPFRLDPDDYVRGEGPGLAVLGRLSPGSSLESARAEVAAVGERAAETWPATHAQLRARVSRYPRPVLVAPSELWVMGAVSLGAVALVALMAVLCANVALLLFARAAAREDELAVRNALGASRGRIVAQLFAEALVLAGVATLLGLMGGSVGLRWALGALERAADSALPFWFHRGLSPATMGWSVVLALVGAVVAGVLPGLRVTGGSAQASLQRLAGRGAGASIGRLWTGIIVTQVALTVAFVPIVAWIGVDTWAIRTADPGLPADQYLMAHLEMDPAVRDEAARVTGAGDSVGGAPGEDVGAEHATAEAPLDRYERAYRELDRRLEAEADVRGATVAGQLPGGWHERRRVEVDGPAAPGPPVWGGRAQHVSVDPDFLGVMGAGIVAGRGLEDGDVGAEPGAVVVNESFVREFLGGRNAVGRRLRYPEDAGSGEDASPGADPSPWYEIVGVVSDLAMTVDPELPHNAGIYHPLGPGEAYPLALAVHPAGPPAAFTGRLREVAAAVDPALRVEGPRTLDEAAAATLLAYESWFRVIVLTGGLALLLTTAGIYAIISFTVSRRTREIGVRVALGADRRQVAAAVLSRMARQVGTGVVVGTGAVMLLMYPWTPSLREAMLLLGYMAVMMGVCMLACFAPTRRALRIAPTEALGAE